MLQYTIQDKNKISTTSSNTPFPEPKNSGMLFAVKHIVPFIFCSAACVLTNGKSAFSWLSHWCCMIKSASPFKEKE